MHTLHRIDKFSVPVAHLDEFVDQVRQLHLVLATQNGIKINEVLTLANGDSPFNVVTHVSWESPAALESAGAAMRRHSVESGFDKAEFMKRLGVTGDFGTYV